MAVLPYIYLGYMFTSLYMLTMFLIIYLRHRKELFHYPEPHKEYTVSFVVPAYNEEKTIGETLKHIFDIDYDITEVIVVNDGSTDKTKEVLAELSKKYPKLRVINNKKNYGRAAIAQNMGLKVAKGEIIAIVDADSYPAKDSLKKMVGFFEDPKVGSVTCSILVRNPTTFIEKLQSLEYKVISLSRKLLDYVQGIYVTPGPLALYKKEVLESIGGFDEKNMTQDIEATWHLVHDGWYVKMCLDTEVTSTAPTKFMGWFKQRMRWNIGGLQCIGKYKDVFLKKGMLGCFIIPLFIISTFLGMVGLSIFFYLLTMRVISQFLFTRYSITANTPLLTLEDFYITPTILNYLGVIMFVTGLVFTLIILVVLKEKIMIKQNLFNIPFFLIIYMAFYPFIMLFSMIQMAMGKTSWR